MALQALANARDQQALALSSFDCFWLFGVAGVCLTLLVPWMRRSIVEKGAHILQERPRLIPEPDHLSINLTLF